MMVRGQGRVEAPREGEAQRQQLLHGFGCGGARCWGRVWWTKWLKNVGGAVDVVWPWLWERDVKGTALLGCGVGGAR
jgi:hypothetical protein